MGQLKVECGVYIWHVKTLQHARCMGCIVQCFGKFCKDVKHLTTHLNNDCLKIMTIFLVTKMLLLVSVTWVFCTAVV